MTNLLSIEDKKIIDEYRKYYALDDDDSCPPINCMCSTEHYLRFWENNKKPLYALLGNKIILKRDISYTPSIEELRASIAQNEKFSAFWDFLSSFQTIIRNLQEDHRIAYPEGNYWWSNTINNAITNNDVAIFTNRVPKTFEFSYIDDTGTLKTFVINKDSKTSKIIGKICTIFGIEGYEQFRLLHSQMLNTKAVKGTLCLSIHPMDFMTMSDNNCDWCSCMSWREYGCYRQGTIEMMNSPYVIVAYIEANDPMRFYDNEWNSKKWRSLFIVHPEAIINVKSYPYAIPDIEKSIVKTLKELAENNCHWYYGEVTPFEKISIPVSFYTNKMYNDISSDSSVQRFCALGESVESKVSINYSGESECAWCGGVSFDRDDEEIEGSLLCDNCSPSQPIAYCFHCGDAIYPGDNYYIIDEEYVCEDCCDQVAAYDPFDREDHLKQYMTQVYIVPSRVRQLSEEERINILTNYADLDSFFTCIPNYTVDYFNPENDEKYALYLYRTKSGRRINYVYTDCFDEQGKDCLNTFSFINCFTGKFSCDINPKYYDGLEISKFIK